MKKYDLSAIMASAWSLYRKYNANLGRNREGKRIIRWTFSSCLKLAWGTAKEAVKTAAEAVKTGLRRMHYSEYKTNYSDCETVDGSYDKATKTIEVMTLKRKGFRRIGYNGLCPRCHTYCYGDCMAH